MHRVEKPAVSESELQRALDCGELIRLYQPIIDLRTGTIHEVENLLRWDHPSRGLLAPSGFLVGEEDTALLVRIGWSVVIEAVRRAGGWRRAFPHHPITVSVNLFDEHLARRDLPTRVEQLLEYHDASDPRALAFEIGERHLEPRRSRTSDRLTILRNLGVEVVVDDFGEEVATSDVTPDELLGSTLERVDALRSFPVDVLKLAPRFVQRLATDERVAAVVAAAHGGGVRVVAVAVEDDRGAASARDAGFDLAQGFHFARPVRPERIDELLAAR